MRREVFWNNCSDWIKLDNMKEMYKVAYWEMIDASIAVRKENPIFTEQQMKKYVRVINLDGHRRLKLLIMIT